MSKKAEWGDASTGSWVTGNTTSDKATQFLDFQNGSTQKLLQTTFPKLLGKNFWKYSKIMQVIQCLVIKVALEINITKGIKTNTKFWYICIYIHIYVYYTHICIYIYILNTLANNEI